MISLSLLLSALMPCAMNGPDEPPRKYQVAVPKDDGIAATGLNELGDVVGFEWTEDPKYPGVISQAPFFARGNQQTPLPLLEGYTATLPTALSDTGLVVGRAGKPITPGGNNHLRTQAFVWDQAGGIRGLGAVGDDSASTACGITRKGDRICGTSLNKDGNRACVWVKDGEKWKATALPHVGQLGSQVVAISGDGKYVAAVDGVKPCLWTRSEDGAWTRETIGDPGSLFPRAVNNSGMVVGLRHDSQGFTHAAIWTREKGIEGLEEPKGYVQSRAHGINNEGVVVGMLDGPRGSEVGPNAFVREKGRLRVLDEAGPNFVDATAINDRGQVTGTMEKAEAEEPKAK